MHMQLRLCVLLLAVLANALPPSTSSSKPGDDSTHDVRQKIISQSQANSFMTSFWDLKSGKNRDPNATTYNLFTKDFRAYSGSFMSLKGEAPLPVGVEHYIGTLGPALQAKPLPDVNADAKRFDYFIIVGSGEHENDVVTHWSWEGLGTGEWRVSGWHCFSMRWEGGTWKAWRTSFDFDSIAWKINQGGKVIDAGGEDDRGEQTY